MEYFAGLDVSMADTQVCVMNRDGTVVYEVKVASMPADIVTALAQAPTCERIVFETGRMAPMLYHGLSQLGLPAQQAKTRATRCPIASGPLSALSRRSAHSICSTGGAP